jgi:hypothetical protein
MFPSHVHLEQTGDCAASEKHALRRASKVCVEKCDAASVPRHLSHFDTLQASAVPVTKFLPGLTGMPYSAAMHRQRQRERRRLLAAVAVCVSVLASPPVVAQPAPPAPVPLVVQRAPAASDCVDAGALVDRVTLLTGRRALVAAETAGGGFAYEVQILKSDEGYTAIVLAGGTSRQIADPGPSCASLSDALSLTLAILVDSDAPPPAPQPEPPPAPEPVAPVATLVPTPPRAPVPTYGPRLFLSPHVALTEGLSGSLVPAVALVNDLRVYRSLSVLAGFTWMPSQSVVLGPGQVEVQLMYGQIAPCLSDWNILGRVRLGGCVQLNVGGLRGRASGYAENRETTRVWTSFGLSGLFDVRVIGPLYFSVRLGAFVNAPQEAFAIDDVGLAFDPPPVGILVGTGVGVRIL